MSRPLCAYPKQARYVGSGPTTDAGSFACVDDGTNDPSLENPARDYLSPLVIQASAPDALNLRNSGGKVVIVLSTPEGSDTFHQWVPSDIKAEGGRGGNLLVCALPATAENGALLSAETTELVKSQ